ncbi:MAG: lipocalin-like domain-containing protein [Rhodoplanes sp.]|uniref:lipocalin-like domain-containing protein n=1 Tax=Rhodoplanes sp. TaxID=1968906 RepID=UPI00183181FF|nr:lipocalin-like domain-containing protein [Rhodoplanes sp.]NVO13054.1 lipocalin-like domain-containing protein [Rhodoplanes sp.]
MSPPFAAGRLDAARFLGAWKLHTWDILYADGRAPTYPFGADAAGWIMYTPDGRMSVTICRPKRAHLATENVRKAPVEERLAAFDSYFTYSGPYTIEDTDVVHHVEFSLNPNFCNTEQRRHVTFEGRRLTLSTDDEVGGVRRTHRLVWERPD